MPVERVRSLRAIPSYYLRYYYQFDKVLADQLSDGHETRAEEVAEIERELLEMYRDPTLDEKPALLANRGGAFYSEAAAQLIASLHDGTGDVQVVNIRNDGAIDGLPRRRRRRDPGPRSIATAPTRCRCVRSSRTCWASSRP